MAETIAGGAAILNGRWVNSEGEPLDKEQIKDAQAMADDRAALRAEEDRALLAQEAQRDPTARAIAAAMAPEPKAAKAAKAEPKSAES